MNFPSYLLLPDTFCALLSHFYSDLYCDILSTYVFITLLEAFCGLFFCFNLLPSMMIICKYKSILGSQSKRHFCDSLCSGRFPFCSEWECMSLLTLLKTTQGTCILLLCAQMAFNAESKWIACFSVHPTSPCLTFLFLDCFSLSSLVIRVNLLFTNNECLLF